MSKAKNPRLQARISPELKEVFDKMLDYLDLGQAEFMEKYLPAMLIAINEDKFFEFYEQVYRNKNLNIGE